ncbi:MAG: hypothetical protein WAN75_14390, partial [Xanthobacteraceae bacterium]
GYCAGGGFALEQARAGADFKALVVFHVTNPNPVVPGTPCNIKASLAPSLIRSLRRPSGRRRNGRRHRTSSLASWRDQPVQVRPR